MLTRLRHLLIEALEWFDAKHWQGEQIAERMQRLQGNRPKVVQR